LSAAVMSLAALGSISVGVANGAFCRAASMFVVDLGSLHELKVLARRVVPSRY
jgi:hypothetical protein